MAESVWSAPGNTYEQGDLQSDDGDSLVAAISLSRGAKRFRRMSGQAPLIDEYSLASRLSYFLWSSMPDEELLKLAGKNELRKNLHEQVKRMFADSKSSAFTENFTGQWLEARDVLSVPIDCRRRGRQMSRFVARRSPDRQRQSPDPRSHAARGARLFQLCSFENDRDVIEFIDSDYTFLNERLATYYGMPDVTGDELPPGAASARQPARRYSDDGGDAHGDVESDANVAGQTWPVYPG